MRKAQIVMCYDTQEGRIGFPLGETLFGKTVLVVGFGGIAHELLPRLKPFGVRLLCVRRSAWGARPDPGSLTRFLLITRQPVALKPHLSWDLNCSRGPPCARRGGWPRSWETQSALQPYIFLAVCMHAQ